MLPLLPAESVLCILLTLLWKTEELDTWLWTCRLGVGGDGLRYSCSQDTQMYILYFLRCLCWRLDRFVCVLIMSCNKSALLFIKKNVVSYLQMRENVMAGYNIWYFFILHHGQETTNPDLHWLISYAMTQPPPINGTILDCGPEASP